MSIEHPDVSAAILAGGRARRLGGADKASLAVGGRRIVDRQLAALRPLVGHVSIVSNDAVRYAGLSIPIVPDAVPDAGALGGLYTALVTSPCDRVVVLACDMPFVTTALLARLIAEADDDVDAVVPRSVHGPEPLCAIYRRTAAAALRAAIDRGERRASVLPAGLRVRTLDPEALAPYDPDGLLFVNVNTPHDYASATHLAELIAKPPENRITEDDPPGSAARS